VTSSILNGGDAQPCGRYIAEGACRACSAHARQRARNCTPREKGARGNASDGDEPLLREDEMPSAQSLLSFSRYFVIISPSIFRLIATSIN